MDGEDLSNGSSTNGVTGLRVNEGKSSKLGERISGLLLRGENDALWWAVKGLIMFLSAVFLRS